LGIAEYGVGTLLRPLRRASAGRLRNAELTATDNNTAAMVSRETKTNAEPGMRNAERG
jgi:hypothetical protein